MADLELIRDFVNTLDREAGRDDLGGADGLARWLHQHGVADGLARTTDRDAADARTVREALRELLRSNNGVETDLASASAALDASARRAGLAVRFDTGRIRLVPAVAGGVAQVLAVVAEAMAEGSWPRLKACRSDTCRWAFVDTARNRSRQWCDMSVCGNREKARAYRQRHA